MCSLKYMYVKKNNKKTHSDRALFDLNALVLSLGGIVPSAYGLGHYSPLGLHSDI